MTRKLLTPRWIITTLLVIAAVGVMVRLGLWQLDRLEDRRAFNTRVSAQVTAPELSLNAALADGLAPEDLPEMEYRPVVVTGSYDPANQVALRNQIYQNQPGYNLLTPLRIDGSDQVVLVDRGYIPMADNAPDKWAQYDAGGPVTVRGILRQAHVPRFAGVPDPTLTPDQDRLAVWNAINLERIQAQVPYPLLPVYVQLAPEGAAASASTAAPVDLADVTYPVASINQTDLTEGSHLSYAFQWFSFAALLAFGYPFFVRSQLKRGLGSGD